ncbi:MAG: hypothetical protein Q8Q25_02850 [bacterium]|nr:hypothetical protein [bacterium]
MKKTLIKQSWWQMTSIQIGGAICLPILMVGQELGKTYGFAKTVGAVLIGNMLLFLLGLAKAKMSFENKDTTIKNASRYFGQYGTFLLAGTMIMSLIGWFAIQLNLIALSVQTSLSLLFDGMPVNIEFLNIILGTIITIAALRGISALEKLADLSVPLLIATIGYVLYRTYINATISVFEIPVLNNSFRGISLVLAATIMAVIDMPTYYRFSRSKRDSFLSIFILFVLAIPIIEITGAYIGLHNPGNTLIETLTAGGGFLYQMGMLLFLVLAGWTTNNANIYSAVVTLEKIAPNISHIGRTLLLGTIGTMLSCFDLLNNLEPVLNGMGILVSSMGAVIATQYILNRFIPQMRMSSLLNILAWICGTAYGFLGFFGLHTLTGFELIDSFLATSAVSTLLTFGNYFTVREKE